jgi:adenylate kinase
MVYDLQEGDPRVRYKTILLFGAPGSGKGTQGKILGSIPGFFHTACGDVFRSLDLKNDLGKVFWEYSSQGKLVPDDLTVRLWKDFIDGAERTNRFHPESEILVLDGIPRNMAQARLMDEHLDVTKVIYLVCADMSKMVERLRRRALKENRIDDANDKVIQHRLQVYELETHPVLEHYPNDRIAQVDATMSQMKVLQKIIDVIVPIKSAIDHARETQERSGLAPAEPHRDPSAPPHAAAEKVGAGGAHA